MTVSLPSQVLGIPMWALVKQIWKAIVFLVVSGLVPPFVFVSHSSALAMEQYDPTKGVLYLGLYHHVC